MMKRWMTIPQIARRLNVDEMVLWELFFRGLCPAWTWPDFEGDPTWPASELMNWRAIIATVTLAA